MSKEYSLDIAWKVFGTRKCPECSYKLESLPSIHEGWTWRYKCNNCKAEYEQEAAATGQDPWLTKVN